MSYLDFEWKFIFFIKAAIKSHLFIILIHFC